MTISLKIKQYFHVALLPILKYIEASSVSVHGVCPPVISIFKQCCVSTASFCAALAPNKNFDAAPTLVLHSKLFKN
jgi:hypothetical protein